jgi:chromosome segregation ATPase
VPLFKDLNSINGSVINNHKIINGASVQLKSGDKIMFGKDTVEYLFVPSINTIPISLRNKPTDQYAIKNHLNPKPTKEPNFQYQNQANDDSISQITEPQKNFQPSEQREDIISKLRKMNEELANKINTLEEEKQFQAKEVKSLNLNIENKAEECEKLRAKHQAVELYASDLQRRLDEAERVIKDKDQLIESSKKEDWAKKLMQYKAETEKLRKMLSDKEEEFKATLKSISAHSNTTDGISKKHYEAFIEQQSKDILKYKKIV